MPKESTDIKTMANMLRRGATLTERSCPVCSSPLFKLRGEELWCVKCQKRAVIVGEGKQSTEATSPMFLTNLESTILTKIQEIEKEIRDEKDIGRLQRLGSILSTLLENVEKIRKIKKR